MGFLTMETAHIDPAGRLLLPDDLLRRLGFERDQDVAVEITNDGLLIRANRPEGGITERIAGMNLPTAAWEQMEREIDAGRLP
jgi:antitoxin component of MazEF toxin-antitoxin module